MIERHSNDGFELVLLKNLKHKKSEVGFYPQSHVKPRLRSCDVKEELKSCLRER